MTVEPECSSACPTCAAPLATDYCSRCGERRPGPDDVSLREYLAQVFGALLGLEGKLVFSLRALLSPGRATRDFLRGARVRFLRPFALFAVLNVAYFFAQPWTGINVFQAPLGRTVFFGWTSELHDRAIDAKRAELGLAAEADWPRFKERYDARSNDWAKSLIGAFLPVLAIASWLAERRRRFAEHLALVTEGLSFKLLVLSIVIPLAWRAASAVAPSLPGLGASPRIGAATSAIGLACWYAWFVVALQRAFGRTRPGAFGAASVIAAGYVLAWAAYHVMLFGVTLASL
ncbi:MAG: DUF3667 domain-containing protein [Planctomycetes bacterium]|nr:DUF3667 domain-containing protein [Planctomycetota bacterium]